MPNTPITLTKDLTDLIRFQRRDIARLTQKAAALAAGGMSQVWWRQIETGLIDTALADTLARMCYAIDVSPEQLRNIGQDKVAELVERRRSLLEPESVTHQTEAETELEKYLLAAPGLTDYERSVLVTVAMGLLKTDVPPGQVSIGP